MSYCRFSSNNGYCEVYVYADTNGGWTTHVAAYRRPLGAPPSPYETFLADGQNFDMEKYKRMEKAWYEWAEKNPRFPINHPEAGHSFNHGTPKECAVNLGRLRSEGFEVPQYAIDALLEEEKENVD